MNKIKFVSLSKPKSINESASFSGEFGGGSFRDCDVVFGPDGTRYVPKDICALVDSAIDIIDGLNYGLMSGYIASLPIVYTFQVPTMATDASHIFINPGFVLELLKMCGNNPIGIGFVITHEIYHVLFKHNERAAAQPDHFTDHRRANIAMDYEINWVIEHSYPLEDDEDPSANYNADGSRVQIFDGVTKTCNGCIDPKYAGMLWEQIYDELDTSDDYKEPQEQDNQEVVYSKDYQDGFRDGCEKAIRELRAQGLVECSISNVQNGMLMLLEAQQAVAQGTYDDGFKEGYKRTIEAVKQALQGGQGEQQGQGQSMNQAPEAPIPNLPTIKLKNPPQNSQNKQSQEQSKINRPNIVSDNTSQQNQNNNQQGKDSDKQDGAQSQSGSQSQGGQGGQNQQGDSNQQSGQDQSQNGQGQPGQQGSNSQLGQGQGGQHGDSSQTPQGNQSQSGQGVQGQETGDQDGQGSGQGSQQAQDLAKDMAKDNLKIIGIAKGYSGKEDNTKGNHILSADDGAKIAEEAGYDDGSDSSTFIGKDNKFSNVDAVKATLRKLGQIMDSAAIGKDGTVIGSDKTPGSGMMGKIGGIINDIYTPDINWKKLLKRYLKGFKQHIEDIGYNKKHIIYGRYNRIKDKEGESAKRLLVCIDTSGSVISSGDYLRRIVANVAEIVSRLGIKYIDVIQFADGVYKDTEFRGTTPPPANKFGIEVESGGTNYDKVFEYIQNRYIDHKKPFQAAVIFTDLDVEYYVKNSRWFTTNKPKYAKKTVWVILTDNETDKDNLGRNLFGKSIFVSPKDFDKNLNYVQDETESNESLQESFSYVPQCMNKRLVHHLDEGNPFGVIKKKNTINQDADFKKAKRPSGIQSRLALDKFDPDDVYTGYSTDDIAKIRYWLNKNLNINKGKDIYNLFSLYKSFSDLNKDKDYLSTNDAAGYIHPKTGEIVVFGDLILYYNALELPDYIKFGTLNGNLIIGNNTKITKLPEGLPAIVNGDVNINGCPKITNLENGPIKANKYIVTACRNLKSLEGAPEKCSFFFSDKFTQNDYLNYIADTYGIGESMKFSRKEFLNEAFNSTKLAALANNPLNKEALAAMRKIKIMWSEIPDSIVNPIYNNVAKSLAKRRDDNKSGEFGVYIWCDKDDKIWIIATGNNKYNRQIPNADYSEGQGWLYIAPGLFDIINERIEMVRNANGCDMNGYTIDTDERNNQRQRCLNLGIKYDNNTIGSTAVKGYVNSKIDLTYFHLLFIPDLCCHAYLIQGSKNSNDKNSVAHFSYNNSRNIREKLIANRARAIKGIIVQGRNLNPKDPAYKRYFEDYYLTDQKILDKFMQVKDLTSLISLIQDEKNAVTEMRRDIRGKLHLLDVKNEIFDIVDMLYKKFCDMPVQLFTVTADDSISSLRKIIERRNTLTPENFVEIRRDLEISYKYLVKDTPLDQTTGQRMISVLGEINDDDSAINVFTVFWASLYTSIAASAAEISSLVYKINNGTYGPDDLLKYALDNGMIKDVASYSDYKKRLKQRYFSNH